MEKRFKEIETFKKELDKVEKQITLAEQIKAVKLEIVKKQGNDMLGQLHSKTQQRELVELRQKEEGLKERHRLEQAVKMAAEAEEKKQIEKRIKLKSLTEQDRKAKEDFRVERAGH